MRQIAQRIVVTGLLALISTPAWAEEPVNTQPIAAGTMARAAAQDSTAAAPMKNVTVSFGADVPTAYYFRGVVQETEGFIIQPFVDVGFTLSEAVSVHVGWWNSAHSADTGFYESDPYASITFATGNWSTGLLYTLYTSPSDAFSHVHELAFVASHDSPLAPSIMLATELKNKNLDNSGNTYLQLGVAPGIPLSDSPVSVSVPVAVGLSVKDYYMGFDEDDEEPTNKFFGYLKAGVAGSVELPRGFEVHAGFDLLFLSDALQFDDKTVKPVFTVGAKFTY